MSTAVVTGAARGIGRAITERLLEDGFTVVAVDMSRTVIDLARDLSPAVAPVVADITIAAGRANVVEAARGGISLLVNNAGITRDALVKKLTDDDLRAVLRVNLGAPIQLAADLRQQFIGGASIVSISSRSHLGNIGQLNYAMSKGGLVGMTRSLALAWGPHVRVNAVAPGFIASDMTAAMPDDVRERIVASIPFGRAGEVSEVADAVAWLASPAASYVTGQVVYVCGGRSVG